jgi:hypothetical protein
MLNIEQGTRNYEFEYWTRNKEWWIWILNKEQGMMNVEFEWWKRNDEFELFPTQNKTPYPMPTIGYKNKNFELISNLLILIENSP